MRISPSPRVLLLATLTASPALSPALAQNLDAELVANVRPGTLYATHAPGDDDHLYVVSQGGTIDVIDLTSDTLLPTPFLQVGNLTTGGERGLLGLAFDPDYAANGEFYVYASAPTSTPGQDHRSTVRRYTRSAGDPLIANPASSDIVLSFDQPQDNHNAGWIGFGPDGHLYVASGDGGGGNDSGTGHTSGSGNAQDITNNLLGKILRIDPSADAFPLDSDRDYTVPGDNPFVGVAGDDEIWAYGLRNPFRNSFDRDTGDLYIGDVGQGQREEIDFQPADSSGGENYGWRLREGDITTPGGVGGAPPPGNVDPLYDYTHGFGSFQGNSVTGGYVYRGPIQQVDGLYFFADFVSNNIWTLDPDDPDATVDNIRSELGSITNITSFGEDAAGHLYIVSGGGNVYRLRLDLIDGDYTGDTLVSQADLDLVLLNWGDSALPAGWVAGDQFDDGLISQNELDAVLLNWGNRAAVAANTAIPEPASALLLGAGALALGRRRRAVTI